MLNNGFVGRLFDFNNFVGITAEITAEIDEGGTHKVSTAFITKAISLIYFSFKTRKIPLLAKSFR